VVKAKKHPAQNVVKRPGADPTAETTGAGSSRASFNEEFTCYIPR
jgi:hypothetical protein